MSNLSTVRKRKNALLEAKKRIDDELAQLEIVESVLIRLDNGAETDGGGATVSIEVTNSLENLSAPEAARIILANEDTKRHGLHYQKIVDHAVRLGYKRGQDPAPDTMRRALAKRDDLFERVSEGVFRLVKK